MNLKTNITFFLILIGAIIYGEESFSLGFYENYYVLRWIDLIIGVLTVITGIFLGFNILKFFKQLKNNRRI